MNSKDAPVSFSIDESVWPGNWSTDKYGNKVITFGDVTATVRSSALYPLYGERLDDSVKDMEFFSLTLRRFTLEYDKKNKAYESRNSLEEVLGEMGACMVEIHVRDEETLPFPEGMPSWIMDSIVKELRKRSTEKVYGARALEAEANRLRDEARDLSAMSARLLDLASSLSNT